MGLTILFGSVTVESERDLYIIRIEAITELKKNGWKVVGKKNTHKIPTVLQSVCVSTLYYVIFHIIHIYTVSSLRFNICLQVYFIIKV